MKQPDWPPLIFDVAVVLAAAYSRNWWLLLFVLISGRWHTEST